MRIRISITTPKGQAKKTDKRIRPYLIGFKKLHKLDVYVNDEDTQIVWDIEGHPRPLLKIQNNVSKYDILMSSIFNSKMLKRKLRGKITKEQEAELEDMLLNQTKVTVVKEATAQEMVEANMTWWERVKEKFHKHE